MVHGTFLTVRNADLINCTVHWLSLEEIVSKMFTGITKCCKILIELHLVINADISILKLAYYYI